MSRLSVALPFLLLACAQPALAETRAQEIGNEAQKMLVDPATGRKIGAISGALVDVLLDMKVGKIAAAASGRVPNEAEANQSVRDLISRNDPSAEAKLRREVAAAGPALMRSMQAMAAILPQIVESADKAAKAVERVEGNLPSPDYPKR